MYAPLFRYCSVWIGCAHIFVFVWFWGFCYECIVFVCIVLYVLLCMQCCVCIVLQVLWSMCCCLCIVKYVWSCILMVLWFVMYVLLYWYVAKVMYVLLCTYCYVWYTKQDTQMRSCARNVFRLERQPLWWIHTSHFLERGGQSNKKSSGATKLTCVGTSSSTPLSTKYLISSNTTKVSQRTWEWVCMFGRRVTTNIFFF